MAPAVIAEWLRARYPQARFALPDPEGRHATHEIRCPGCGGLLARVSSGAALIQLKCRQARCKRLGWGELSCWVTASGEIHVES